MTFKFKNLAPTLCFSAFAKRFTGAFDYHNPNAVPKYENDIVENKFLQFYNDYQANKKMWKSILAVKNYFSLGGHNRNG